MKARVKWVEDRTIVGEANTGHKVAFGAPYGPEGLKPGPSPMELVLIGTGGCSAYDVVHILEMGREAVEDCVVELDADRAEGVYAPMATLLSVSSTNSVSHRARRVALRAGIQRIPHH
jgi:uncharacterized OsmC-like protein